MKNSVHLALFASGNGTNAEAIIRRFENSSEINVKLVLSNNSSAHALVRAENHGIENHSFTRKSFYETTDVLNLLEKSEIDLIVLAGFMWLVPQNIIDRYDGRIINIHPALLPSYGGKGMYGMQVHQAVLENLERYSGITIHFVNGLYDDGDIIFQAKCKAKPDDTTESLANRIHQLEHEHYPRIIQKLCKELVE